MTTYEKWLEIKAIEHSLGDAGETEAAQRIRCAFSWADAINQFPDLTTEEIASAACSVFGGRIFL